LREPSVIEGSEPPAGRDGNRRDISDAIMFWAAIRMYVGRWGQSAAAGWSMVPLGLILLIAVIALEDYYRKGMESGVLLNRFLKVTAIEVAVAVVMLVLMAVLAASA